MDSVTTHNKYFCERCKDQNYLIECNCGRCNEVIFLRGSNFQIRNFARNHQTIGEYNGNWKNGIRYTRNYRYILMPDYPRAQKDGYVPEHIYVYQEYNKCCLLPWGEVHHLDPVREGYCNNMPWNLIGVTKWQHRTLDRTKNLGDNICYNCKSPDTYIKENGRPMWYYDKEDNPLCMSCYNKLKHIKKERKKKDWTGTTCYLCGADKTRINHRGNYDWRHLDNDPKKPICSKCYKKEYKKRVGKNVTTR